MLQSSDVLRAVFDAHHVQDALGSLSIKSKIGREPSEKSPFQALHPAVDEHEIRCHSEGGPSKPCRDLSCCSLDDRRRAALLDERTDPLNPAADSLTRAVSEPMHGPDNVVRALRFFRGHMPTGLHCRDEERNECVVFIECAHTNWATSR